jgi:alcohol dehydrogenase
MNFETIDTNGTWEHTIGPVRVLFGGGRLAELGEATAGLGIRRPLLVSDPGLRDAGHAATAKSALEAVGLDAAAWFGATENPTAADVERGAAAARTHTADGLVALGGGSAMDCAKGINFVVTNGGSMTDYRGYGKATRPLLPALGVPTTAGTGSEAQSYSLISHPETREKMACGDPGASFRVVILDPELARTAPAAVVAASGLDAISHAVESYVSTRRNPVSTTYARAAWRLLEGALETVLAPAAKDGTWAEMLLGAHLAGAAIEQSMLGAGHATANPLTARHGLAHGAAVLLMLPWVVRFNGEACEPLYRELMAAGNGARPEPIASGSTAAAEALARRLERLRTAGGLPARLREVGVLRQELPELARLAAVEWTAGFNPRPAGARELERLYEAAW